MVNLFKPKCPNCGQRTVKKIKEGFWHKFFRQAQILAFPILIFFKRGPKTTYFCTNCKFQWQ